MVLGDKMDRKQVALYMDKEEVAFLTDESRRMGRSLSWLIRSVMKEWIRERKGEADGKR